MVAGLLAQGAFRVLLRPQLLADLAATAAETAGLAPQRPGAAETRQPGAGDLDSDLTRTGERVAGLVRTLGIPTESGAVLQSLPALASAAGVRFRRFAPEPEYRLDGHRARAAAVTAEGGFFDLLGLFERIARLPQLVLIDELELEAGPDGLIECRFVAVSLRVAETGMGLASGANQEREALRTAAAEPDEEA